MGVKVNELDIEVKSNLGDLKNSFKNLNKSMGAVKKSFGEISKVVKKFYDDVGEATDEVEGSVDTSSERVKKSFKEIFKEFRNKFKSFRGRLKTFFSVLGKILRSFVRIGFYRIIRTILSTITNGFKEGTENAYLFARAMGLGVAKQLDSISTSMLYLKNQIGAIGIQLLATLQPIIDRVVNNLAVATENIAKFFAVLNGGSEYIVATRNAKAFAKAQRDILGFDEINKLSGDTTNNLYSFITKTLEGEELAKVQQWVDKFQKIKEIVKDIGTFLLAWKVSTEIANLFNLTGLGLPLGIMTAGAVLTIELAKKYVGEGKFTMDEFKKIITACFGVGFLAFVSMSLFTGSGILGAIAFTVGCVVTLALSTLIKDADNNTEKIKEKIKEDYGLESTAIVNDTDLVLPTNNKTSVVGAVSTAKSIVQNSSSRTSNVRNRAITTKANGGYVNSGELFLARENGISEYVGSIGNKTAVANNDQIVEAIKQGVFEAMSKSNSNVNVTLEGDAKGLFKVIQQQAKQYAYATGTNAF